MTDFNKTRWADREFAKQYREKADSYIVERQRMFGIMRSYANYFFKKKKDIKVLDLGCGDGIVTANILETGRKVAATLVDASDDMLDKAKQRLKGAGNTDYIKASFQEIMKGGLPEEDYDMVVSSMAIHHLTMDEKRMFFGLIGSHLKTGGCFLNIDVVLPPTAAVDEWYMKLWEEWMNEKRAALNMFDEPSGDVIVRYREGEENQPDTIDDQLAALRSAGFSDVDCYYKYGIFVVYGGQKAEVPGTVYFPDI